jgi:hypothetical protein
MNIYDLKQVCCYKCGKYIGEIHYDAEITMPLCGPCADPIPKGDDKLSYTASKYGRSLVNTISA